MTDRADQEANGLHLPEGAGEARQSDTRREFMVRLGIGAGLVALGGQVLAYLRSLVPNVSYDPPTTVKVGMPADYPEGMKFLPEQRLFVFREGTTFHAISAVCTHLGCTVRAEALAQSETATVEGASLKMTHRFLCPCHGSRYTGDGKNVAGPAPRPLDWFHLSVSPDDGQLVVDLARPVGRNFRLTIS